MTKIMIGIYFCICILGSVPLLEAQTLPFRNYSSQDGLPDSAVYCILQDNRGYLWIGTSKGLSRFDGQEFNNYHITDGLPDDFINTIFEARNGDLWIGTQRGGVICIRNGRFISFKDRFLSTDSVITIAEDQDGKIWIGAKSGLYHFDGTQFIRFTHADGLFSDIVSAIVADDSNHLWLGTLGGIQYFSVKSHTIVKSFTTANGLLDNRILKLLLDSRGRLWIGTPLGLSCLKNDSIQSYTVKKNGLCHDAIFSLYEDRSNNIWIGTWNGLSRLKESQNTIQFENYSTANGLLRNFIMSIYQDKEGNLWFSSSAGLNCLSTLRTDMLTTQDGLINNFIRAIIEDKQHRFWIATGEGLSCYIGSSFKNYTTRDGLISNNINRLWEDPQGNLWILTLEGLSIWNGSSFKNYTQKDGLISNMLFSVAKNYDGKIYIGTNKGICCYDPFTQHFSSPPFQTSNIPIYTLYEDRRGHLWFASDNGLYWVSGESTTLFSTSDSLPSNHVNNLYEDKNGKIWICTTNGLSSFIYDSTGKPGRFFNYSPIKEVPNLSCYFTLEDNSGILWIGTDKGLISYDDKAFKVYNSRQHGLTSDYWSNALKDSNGKIWLGSLNGITRMIPPPVSLNTLPPPIYITSIQVMEKEVTPLDMRTLEHTRNYLRFAFTGICFRAPQSVKYKYRLSGLDVNWLETKERYVSYHYLPPGSYRFYVKAINNDGIESVTPAEIRFKILPPFWKTWWFQILIILSALSLVLFFAYWRLKRARERMELQMKEIELQARTRQLVMLQRMELMGMLAAGAVHDLKSLMGIIIGYSQMTAKKFSPDDASYRNIEKIKNTATTAVQVVTQILAFARQKNDNAIVSDIGELLESLMDTLKVSTPAFIKINWKRPEKSIRFQINPTRFQQLVMNLCLNAVQAMPKGGELTVILNESTSGSITLDIGDTGTGITPDSLPKIFDPFYTTKNESEGTGLGLFVVKQILDEYQGSISVESQPGKGTVFHITFPAFD